MEKKEVICIKSVCKNYITESHTVKALDEVSLTVFQNDYIAIMGPSGSGKSTLMNVIGCLDSIDSGLYLLNGTDVRTLDDDSLALVRNREIGFVFQSFNLLPGYTVLENVELPLVYRGVPSRERRQRAMEVLDKVQLSDRLDHLPEQLSGGQRQRVAIARALVGKPSIILADEPTGNLDSATSKEIMSIFEQLYNDFCTIIVVTHENEIAQCARKVVFLKDGKIDRIINN